MTTNDSPADLDRLRVEFNGPVRRLAVDAERLAIAEARAAHREAAVRVETLRRDLGERYSPERATLERFELYDAARQRPALNRLQAIEPDAIRAGLGLVLYGPVGTGKDHLLAAMLYRAAGLGLTARWVNGQEVFGEFRDRMDSRGQTEDAYLEQLLRPDVLGISDPIPPRGDPSAWNLTQLYRILDRRYRALKATWLTLNVLTVADADKRLTAPVFDRIQDGAELIPCFWESYRRPKS